MREFAKVIAFATLGRLRHAKKLMRPALYADRATILNLHRVAEDDGSDYRPLAPSLFDELLSFVKKEFSVVTIEELADTSRKPKLVLSFDDGYRDFLTCAVPILRKHGLRANQNVIPQCVESGLPPLNVLAQDFVGKAPKKLVENLRIDGFHAPLDARFGHRLSNFLKLRPQAEQDMIAQMLLPQFFAYDRFVPTAMMSREEIGSLDSHEIGAHSFCHSSMAYETDDFLDKDVARCAAYFRDRLARPMKIYAFPNGSTREGQAERVLSNGVAHVLLVGERFDDGTQVHTRFTFDGRTKSEVRFKALGGRAPL